MVRLIAIALLLLSVAAPVHAELSGDKKIFLVGRDGENLEIGQVKFQPEGAVSNFDITIDESKFEVYFLSMRNFRCLKTGKNKICYLPYPYKIRNQVRKDDLTDLEYQLLFILVHAGESGINAWNGIYYNMSLGKDGKITGQLMESDLNVLAVPPDKDYARPIAEIEMMKGSGPKYHFPKIEIR